MHAILHRYVPEPPVLAACTWYKVTGPSGARGEDQINQENSTASFSYLYCSGPYHSATPSRELRGPKKTRRPHRLSACPACPLSPLLLLPILSCTVSRTTPINAQFDVGTTPFRCWPRKEICRGGMADSDAIYSFSRDCKFRTDLNLERWALRLKGRQLCMATLCSHGWTGVPYSCCG